VSSIPCDPLSGFDVLPPRVRNDPSETSPAPIAKTGSDRWLALNRFVDTTLKQGGVTPTVAMVWLVLYRSVRDGHCTVANSRIMALTGLSESTVERTIGALRRLRLIERTGGGHPGRASTYRVRGTCWED